jgi:glycosyltransferase involved in cell wall biosynthesis
MKILVVSQYFWPEPFIINDLVRTLVDQGNTVEVLTGKPNYPDGEIYLGYDEGGCVEESFGDGISVHRVPLRPRKSGGAGNLLMNYLSFVTNGLRHFRRAVGNRHFDSVLVFAPSPITSAIPAIWLKWRLGLHLAIWVQDLWPESLRATGFIHNRALLRVTGWLVRGIYAAADTLLVQSRAFHAPVARYADSGKIVYFPNSYREPSEGDVARGRIPPPLAALLEHNFCAVFAGNLGSAQSVETLLAAAEQLSHLTDCRLVLVGSGSMLPWLEEQKARRRLDNLILAGRFAPTDMPGIFRRAACLLVTLRGDEIFAYTIPSKIQAYLAAGRPIIAALDGEGARVIEEACAGLTCPAEDSLQLARCIERLYGMSMTEREQLGLSGRAYFLEHFEMARQAQRLVEILSSRIDKHR